MTNIRLRIEDAVPEMQFGSVGGSLFTELGWNGTRELRGAPVAYRMTPVVPARALII